MSTAVLAPAHAHGSSSTYPDLTIPRALFHDDGPGEVEASNG